MKTSIFVLSALFAPSGAVKISDKSKFMPLDLMTEVDKEVNDTNYLEIGVNIRQELQGQLRSFLEGEPEAAPLPPPPVLTDRIGEKTDPPPGTPNMTNMPFTRLERHVEQRFTERRPYERFPAWVLPGSEAILPKKSADLNLWDDELDLKGNFHYKADYNPTRELYLQLPEDSMIEVDEEAQMRTDVRNELRHTLRAYLEKNYNDSLQAEVPVDTAGRANKRYPWDKFPSTILPGSEAILPKASKPLDLYDGQMTDDWHKNHRSTYDPRTHKFDNYSLLQTDLEDDGEITVQQARIQAAQMQAQMDKAVADADEKRAAQQVQYEANIENQDPAAQLQGLMNAQQSLHRLTSAFSAKPNMEKVNNMAQKLGIPMTPELMQLGSNEAISNALVEIAVGMGKSEKEIEMALD